MKVNLDNNNGHLSELLGVVCSCTQCFIFLKSSKGCMLCCLLFNLLCNLHLVIYVSEVKILVSVLFKSCLFSLLAYPTFELSRFVVLYLYCAKIRLVSPETELGSIRGSSLSRLELDFRNWVRTQKIKLIWAQFRVCDGLKLNLKIILVPFLATVCTSF